MSIYVLYYLSYMTSMNSPLVRKDLNLIYVSIIYMMVWRLSPPLLFQDILQADPHLGQPMPITLQAKQSHILSLSAGLTLNLAKMLRLTPSSLYLVVEGEVSQTKLSQIWFNQYSSSCIQLHDEKAKSYPTIINGSL